MKCNLHTENCLLSLGKLFFSNDDIGAPRAESQRKQGRSRKEHAAHGNRPVLVIKVRKMTAESQTGDEPFSVGGLRLNVS